MNFVLRAAAVAAFSCFVALPAMAVSITVNNASFETLGPPLSNSNPPAVWNVGPIPGWTSVLSPGSYGIGQSNLNGFGGNPPASDGTVFAYIEGTGYLSQDVATTVSGTTYTLQVDVLNRIEPTVPMLGVVSFALNGVVVQTAPAVNAGDGTWNLHTVSWTALAADAGKTLSVRLSSTGSQGDFDNVRVSAVPEPGSYALLLAGLASVGAVVRRRQR